MNAAITKLFVVVVVLFALLIGWTSRWTVFDASSLTTNVLNKRTVVDDLRIKRGRILRRRRHGAGEVDPRAGWDLEADLPDRVAVRPAGRLSERARGPGRPVSSSHTRPDLRGDADRAELDLRAAESASGRRRHLHDPRSEGAARSRASCSPVAAEPAVALNPQTGDVYGHVLEPDLQRQHPERDRCRTVDLQPRRRRPATRPARRSRS